MCLGPTYASSLYIEAPSGAFDNENDTYDGRSVNKAGSDHNGKMKFQSFPSSVPIVVASNKDAGTNVDRLINKIKDTNEWSDKLSVKSNTDSYSLDLENYITYSSDKKQAVIDLENKGFEGKVVYINADSDLASVIQSDQPLTIKKDSSTVIVFNIENEVVTGDTFDLGKVIVKNR